jgi:hypothetical protein
MNRTIARSISRPITSRLHKRPVVGKVLAVFDHACDLVDQNNELTALVTPQIGDGPLNIVVDGEAGFFSGSNPGSTVTLGKERIATAGWRVDLTGASVWEPSPDWDKLRAQRAAIVSHLPFLLEWCFNRAPEGSLLALRAQPEATHTLHEAIFSEAQMAAGGLREGCVGDRERLQEGAVGLAGLGNGLTPAGDDFLAGAMLWAWLAHPSPESLCHTIVDVAAPRTTTLSAAFLRATARGECAVAWHRLLDALSDGHESVIVSAARLVLSHGATSGADSLSGFLYIASWYRTRSLLAPPATAR